MTLNQIFEVNPHLLHADVSAIVARNTFGVSDTQRLNTIADRALGRPDTR
jgi:HD superfamily phosphohydrolase YqeK